MTLAPTATNQTVDPLALAEHTLRRLPSLRPAERERARNRIIELCLPWTRREAARYRHSGESLDDLVQVAMVGLILAVDRYDPDRRIPFRHFALPTVTGEIKKHFRDRGWSVRVSRRTQELYQEIRRVEPHLMQRLGRTPTDGDLAEHLNLSPDEIREGRRGELAYRARSLNRPTFADDESGELLDSLGGNDHRIDRVADHDALRRAIPILPQRMRQLLSLRFLEELTQCEIAERMGISQMHVSRLITRALGRLREHMLADGGV